MVSLVLGDDHMVFLDALSTVLSQHGYTVSAVASSAAEMVASVHRERPDACLIDRRLVHDHDGETIGRVLAASDRTTVLVLSGDPRATAVDRALDAGAAGYVHQSRGVDALVSSIGRVLRGEVVVDVPAAGPVRRTSQPDPAQRLAARLTGRERECLLMLLEGLDTAAMVQRLGVSRTTVRTHLQAVRTKLGVHSRLEAASFAVRHRLAEVWSADDTAEAPNPVREIRPGPAAGVPPRTPARQLAGAARRSARPA